MQSKDLYEMFNKLNKEIIAYIFVGCLTTAVDYISFFIFNEFFKFLNPIQIDHSGLYKATIISWIAAVIFAYFANKHIVFKKKNLIIKDNIKEFISFFSSRLLSGLISLFLMSFFVEMILLNEYIAKLFISLFNLIFNYIVGKFFVFKK